MYTHTGAAHGDTRATDGAEQMPAGIGAGTPARCLTPGVKRDLKIDVEVAKETY